MLGIGVIALPLWAQTQAPVPGSAAPAPYAVSTKTPGLEGHGAVSSIEKGKKPNKKPDPKPIDINSASKAQLLSVPGIGEAEATKIIASRPFLSKADLVTQRILPEGLYVSLKKRLMAKPPKTIKNPPSKG